MTSLLDSGKNKAIAAAGPAAAAPAAAAGAATRGGAASLQNAPFATPKHHATEGRNDLQINRKNKFPGGRNVPSEILLEILSYPISYPISCYRLMDTTRNAETPPDFVPKNAPFATPKHHATEGRNDLQINRKNKFPGGRNVPSEIVLEILSNPAIPSPAILLESC